MTRRQSDGPPRDALEASRIVTTLAAHGVDYVMIGGLAVQAHGHVRTTQDADVLPASDRANLERLADALRALNARPLSARRGRGHRPLDADLLAHMETLSLDTDAGGVDVHRNPPGAAPYEDLRARGLALELFGARVVFADRDDLIAMKKASRRPIDLGDIAALAAADEPLS